MRNIVVVGHPLAAAENRLAFAGWKSLRPHLIAPAHWPVRSLGVTYAASSNPGSDAAAAITALPCRWAGSNSFFSWRHLEKTLDSLKPSLIYGWDEPWCLATRQACLWTAKRKIPFVFYSAENKPKPLPFPFRSLLRKVFAQAQACVTPTPAIAANIARLGFSRTVLTLPLWLAPRKLLRPDFSRKTVAYVGRLIALKRVDRLLDSLALLPEFRLRVIGDGPERKNLVKQAQRQGIGDRVEFMGHIEHTRLEAALEGCGCVALPTAATPRQAEQFGKAVLEGVLCGLPVLVSDSGELARWPERFPSVRSLGSGDAGTIAQAVQNLWENPPSPEILLALRDQVWENYGAEAVGRRMENAFFALLETPP